MRVRVERDISPELVGKRLETIDAEVGAEDALKSDPTDARPGETGEVPEGGTAQARRSRDIGHDERAILPAGRANGTG